MGNLSRKLFKNTCGVSPEKAKKISDEEGNTVYAEIVTCLLIVLHNDFGFGRIRLLKALASIDEFMTAIKKYSGNPIPEMRKILLEECKFNIVEEYTKLMRKQA